MMTVSAGATGLHAWLVRPALDDVLIKGDKTMLLLIPLAIIFTTLSKGIATYLHSFQMSKVAHNIIATLQLEMFEKLMFYNLSFFYPYIKHLLVYIRSFSIPLFSSVGKCFFKKI